MSAISTCTTLDVVRLHASFPRISMDGAVHNELCYERSMPTLAIAIFVGVFTRRLPSNMTGVYRSIWPTNREILSGRTQRSKPLRPQFAVAFPDAHHSVDDRVAEGDKVVLRTTACVRIGSALQFILARCSLRRGFSSALRSSDYSPKSTLWIVVGTDPAARWARTLSACDAPVASSSRVPGP